MVYILILLITLLTVLQLVIRTNSGIVFLAVCAGSVLLSAAGTDVDLLAHSVGSGIKVSSNAVQAGVVLLPGIFTAILLRKRIVRSKLAYAVIPAFCSSVVALTLVYPFLSGSFQRTLTESQGWELVAQYYQFIVVIGIVTSLATIAMTIPHHPGDKHKKGKH